MKLRYIGKTSESRSSGLTWLAGERNDHGSDHNRQVLLFYWLTQQELDAERAEPRIWQERN